ncbi:MAG: radical SAM protein [Candidatus Gracilibacteria bacterium]|nr:radical SAM protein [Candidatus Gracilibacteria bacterium]
MQKINKFEPWDKIHSLQIIPNQMSKNTLSQPPEIATPPTPAPCKKIALIQPIIKDGNSLGIQKSPTGIQSLAGQFIKTPHEVRLFHSEEGVALDKSLAEFTPDIVGISTMTPSFPAGRRIAQTVKATRKDIVIILGGWHASGCVAAYNKGQETESLGEILREDSPFDYVFSGEGELALPEIVDKIARGESITEIPGIGFRDTEGIRLNTAHRIRDLNVLEDPSWEGLNHNIYRDKRTRNLDLSVHAKRACRFNCGFCSTPTVYGRGISSFTPSRAIEYILKLISEKSPEVITFTDEDFFANMKWVEELVTIMEERGFGETVKVDIDTFASINDLLRMDEELLKRMKKVGFGSFTIGIESFNAKTLKKYNKEPMIRAMLTSEQKESGRDLSDLYFECAQKAIDKAQRNGILVCGDYIIGNFGESREEVLEGFAKFSELKGLLIAYIPLFTPFPGTALWKEAYESGKIKRLPNGDMDWESFNASFGAFTTEYGDMEKFRDELELRFYTSVRYISDMLEAIKTRPELLPMFEGRFSRFREVFANNQPPQNSPGCQLK